MPGSFMPLHASPAGKRLGRVHGELTVTDQASQQLGRFPRWIGLTASQQARVVEVLAGTLKKVA